MATTPNSKTRNSEEVPEVMNSRELEKAGQASAPALVLPKFDEDALRSLSSFDDVLALMAETGVEVDRADEVLGDGFTVINDKSILVGAPSMFMEWHFNEGNMGKFVSARVVSRLPGNAMGKFIINDGSTGLMEQLQRYSMKTGKFGGLMVPRGLRRSDYDVTIEGETRSATTFYLDLSAQ